MPVIWGEPEGTWQPGDDMRITTGPGSSSRTYTLPMNTIEFQRPDPKGLRARFWFAVRWLAGAVRKKAGARLDAMRAEQYPGVEEVWGHFRYTDMPLP